MKVVAELIFLKRILFITNPKPKQKKWGRHCTNPANSLAIILLNMDKNFDDWNNKKKVLENRQEKFLFKEGDIWWCSVGLNIKEESCGKGEDFQRPVLVLKKLSGNSFIGVPLSTKEKIGTWFTDINIFNEKRCVLLYQIRMFSSNRFQRRLATLDDNDFSKVKEKLKALLELS